MDMRVGKFVTLIIVFVALLYALNSGKMPVEVSQLMSSNSPVVGMERVEENKFLILFMKSFVERNNGEVRIRFGEGKISFVSIEPRKKLVKEFWNYTLDEYRSFSFPSVKEDEVLVAAVSDLNSSEVLRISLRDRKIKSVVKVGYYVLRVEPIEEAVLLTGFDAERNVGKATVVKNSSKVFEREIGNRVTSSLVFDVNGDGREDFVISSFVTNSRSTQILVFLNTENDFREFKRIEVAGEMIWDIKLANLPEKEIVLFSPKGIYLLNPESWRVKKIFEAGKGYYIYSLEPLDFDGDGMDEFFGVYHNETHHYFIGLDYFSGELEELFETRINLKGGFIVKHLEDEYFLLGAVDGLYLLKHDFT